MQEFSPHLGSRAGGELLQFGHRILGAERKLGRVIIAFSFLASRRCRRIAGRFGLLQRTLPLARINTDQEGAFAPLGGILHDLGPVANGLLLGAAGSGFGCARGRMRVV